MTTTYGSRKLHKDKKLDLMLMEDSDPEDSDPEDMKAIKGEGEFMKVKRMPGMYYKVSIFCCIWLLRKQTTKFRSAYFPKNVSSKLYHIEDSKD